MKSILESSRVGVELGKNFVGHHIVIPALHIKCDFMNFCLTKEVKTGCLCVPDCWSLKQASHSHPLTFKFCFSRWKSFLCILRIKVKGTGNVGKRKFLHRWNSILISIFLLWLLLRMEMSVFFLPFNSTSWVRFLPPSDGNDWWH